MKQLSTIILLLIISFSCKEKSSNKSTAYIQETAAPKISNTVTKTASHIKIPNSHLYIIPPAGFAVDELSGTLAQKEGIAHFMQMQILSGYTPEIFFSEIKTEADKNFPGSWKEETVTVNGHIGTIYHSKTAAYSQYYFAFTDGYTDEMIIANYDEKDEATDKGIYEAFKTVVLEK